MKETICKHCQHEWVTKSKMILVTCVSCGLKTNVSCGLKTNVSCGLKTNNNLKTKVELRAGLNTNRPKPIISK